MAGETIARTGIRTEAEIFAAQLDILNVCHSAAHERAIAGRRDGPTREELAQLVTESEELNKEISQANERRLREGPKREA